MPRYYTEEQKKQAIRMYRNKTLTINEISNLSGIEVGWLACIFRKCFEDGTLKPRNEKKALKPATPKGQGKGAYKPHPKPPKYDEEQRRQIAIDYYENGLTRDELVAKWNIHPMQLQEIRNQYRSVYGTKKNRHCKTVLQFDKNGQLVAKFENCTEAGRQTGVNSLCIWKCCNGRQKTAGGYVWQFEESACIIATTHPQNSQ